ncbi:MAG: hypothetical protein EB015_22560, partial [Methylocystaceae bacterium]|nr:hypothetical protein [Methylocystaceae bacterium]
MSRQTKCTVPEGLDLTAPVCSARLDETFPPLSLGITDAAAQHIVSAMPDAEGDALGVRVSVKKAGCSGYEYVLEYAYDLKAMD